MRAESPVTTIASYDEEVRKNAKLPTVSTRPTSSVVRTTDRTERERLVGVISSENRFPLFGITQ